MYDEYHPYTPFDIKEGDVVKWNPTVKFGMYGALNGVTRMTSKKVFSEEVVVKKSMLRLRYGVLSIEGRHYPRATLLVKGVDYE